MRPLLKKTDAGVKEDGVTLVLFRKKTQTCFKSVNASLIDQL